MLPDPGSSSDESVEFLVTDLVTGESSRLLSRARRQFKFRTPWWIISLSTILLVSIIALFARANLAVFGNRFGVQLPQHCPASPLKYNDLSFPPAIGQDPLWLSGFATQQPLGSASVHLDPNATSPNGYMVPILWSMQAYFTEPITVVGSSVDSSQSDILQFDPQQQPVLFIDPSTADTTTNDWLQWHSAIYIPTSGCYAIHAAWDTGGWTAYFAANL